MEIKGKIDFRKGARLGDPGWFSEVFFGYDPQLATTLAFKCIKKESLEDVDAFFAESQQVQKAQHLHVVEIKYACQTDDEIWIVMPLYSRGSLQALMNQRFLTGREVIRYAVHFLKGIHHIHGQSLLHLDIKPSNILISDNDEALIADFGCSRVMDENFFAESKAVYPLHQVPERFLSNKLGIEADIFQAGLTLYRLCNGDALFFQPIDGHKTRKDVDEQKVRDKINAKIKKGKYPDRSLFLPHVPDRLRRAIRKALQVNPDDRFHSAAEFINALGEVDSNLDWQFVDGPAEQRWTLETPASTIAIVLTKADGGVTITTTKTNKETGNTQRSTKHCGTRANLAEGHKFISEIALEMDSA